MRLEVGCAMATTPSCTGIAKLKSVPCCICARKVGFTESVIEERPTGEAWKLEDWYYCVDCWLSMNKLRQLDINPEVLLSVLEL